jgi:hypothetical protein
MMSLGSSGPPRGISTSDMAADPPATSERTPGSRLDAASTTKPHSRYHGWTTGPSATTAISAVPSAATGPICRDRSSSTAHTTAATSPPAPRQAAMAPSMWSPAPNQDASSPVNWPIVVVTDNQLRTSPGVCRACTQP